MKSIVTFTLILVIALLTACGGSPAAAEPVDSGPVSALSTAHADALPVRNQLALGTLRLEDNPAVAITPEQAAKLLPLWQGLNNLSGSGTGATAEINAMLAQIEGEMTAEQLETIKAMQLTRSDIQAVAQEWGVSGSEGGQPGAGAGLSDAEREARRATRQASGEASGGGMSTALAERLVQLLQERMQ
ncbi:MAG: hypothetical protein Kow0031_24890 [Anaerolineae bacterium]